MPIEVIMPSLSPTMTKGKLVCWHIQPGDMVEIGDVIAEIETDKAIIELEALVDGQCGKLILEENSADIPINTVMAYLLKEGEDISVLENLEIEEIPEVKTMPDKRVDETKNIVNKVFLRSELPDDMSIPKDTKMVEVSMRDALRDAMAEEMRRCKDVFVMGEEVAEYQGAYKVTQGLLQEFGDKRVIDTPIVEHGFAGLGVGAAFAGLRPVIEFMTFNFAMQAIDHIINSAAKTHYMSGGEVTCPIVFRGPNGAARRVAAQHSQDYSAWYAHIPGLKVVSPYRVSDAKALLKAAIRDPNPVLVLESELLYAEKGLVPVGDNFVIPIGRANILREGKDVTLVSHSHGLVITLQAAKQLEADGVSCEVIDLRSLRPLDGEMIVTSVGKTNRLVTVEEGWPVAGIGAEIAALVQQHAFDDLDAPIIRVTAQDVPMPYAENLEKASLPSVQQVIDAVNQVCYR